MIGRAPTSDWCLPDPTLHISSQHCEIRFIGGRYELIDRSTNGTFLSGDMSRLAGPHVLAGGDAFVVGQFEIVVALDDAAAAAAHVQSADPRAPEWRGWTSTGAPGSSAAPTNPSSWNQPLSGSAISGTGPLSESWAPPRAGAAGSGSQWGVPEGGSEPQPAASAEWSPPPAARAPAEGGWSASATSGATNGWDSPDPTSAWQPSTPEPRKPASEWSSPLAVRPPGHPEDVWGKFSTSNLVDWARGGFGARADAAPPIMAAPPDTRSQHPTPAASTPTAAAYPSPSPAQTPAPVPRAGPARPGLSLEQLAAAAGLPADRLQLGEAQTIAVAGSLLRRLVAGMVVMLEARMRAKSQLGAQVTSLEFDGNNPLKFSRTPDQALAQLLNAPERGFMDSERAVEDAFRDLQAHQMATLRAMQGALRATLDRFSPTAIRARTKPGGLLAKILPLSRSARLWDSYEREFGGVARGSDEAFMDTFAREFRNAYEEMSRRR